MVVLICCTAPLPETTCDKMGHAASLNGHQIHLSDEDKALLSKQLKV